MDTFNLEEYRLQFLIVVAMAVLVVSIIPIPDFIETGSSTGSLSIVFHLIGYATLALLAKPIVRSRFERTRWQVAIITVVGVTGYGALIELVQAPISYRNASVIDVVVNAIGAVIGVIIGTLRPLSR